MSDSPRWRRVPGAPSSDFGRDVDDELQFHIDMLAQDLVTRGMTEGAAHDEAERRFGAVRSVRDACVTIDRRRQRHLTWKEALGTMGTDIRFALRSVRRAPGFSAAIIGTLV